MEPIKSVPLIDSFESFRELLFSGEYSKLGVGEYEASMGHEYFKLKSIMRDWGNRLHSHGLQLPGNELEIIFRTGLLVWYVDYLTQYYVDIQDLEKHYQDVVAGKRRVCFYDMIRYRKLYNVLKKRRITCTHTEKVLQFIESMRGHKSYQSILHANGYRDPISFHDYLISREIADTYLQFIRQIAESSHHDLPKSRLLDKHNLVDMVCSPYVVRLGTIFQRQKIIVENLEKLCENFGTDDTFSQETRGKIYSDLLIYDRFATRVQEMIFHEVCKVILCVLGTDTLGDEIDPLDHQVYDEIEKIINSVGGDRLIAPQNKLIVIQTPISHFFGF
jgi:hypothetical protein